MSFSSADEKLSRLLESGVPSPSERLHTLARVKQEGFACGMFLMPVVPFLTDTTEVMENTLRKASEIGLDYVVFGGMTLKEGRRKEYFLNAVLQAYPGLEESYRMIYLGNKWGAATSQYYAALNQTFHHIASQYNIPKRIPARLYHDILSENDLVVVILEQLDSLLKQKGQKTPYGYAAYSISQPLNSKIRFPQWQAPYKPSKGSEGSRKRSSKKSWKPGLPVITKKCCE